MMRFLFGAVLALLVVYPSLFAVVLTVVSQPAVLAFAAGVLAWPRISRHIRGWTR